ncbi:hypothetical protein THIOKS13020039 [Thiocapsa sp. KS1]|nr:hypothetical protein THIOKS13020039 [Thiocapsa sp. KS1]
MTNPPNTRRLFGFRVAKTLLTHLFLATRH